MQMFEQLPFGSIVLIDDSLRLLFQQSLLKEKKGLFGVSFLSLSAWMKQLHPSEGISKEQTLFSYRRLLREHSASFPIFSLQFNDHSFLQQCADFLGECKTSNADLKLLPERNENEKELKRILQLLEPLPHPADEQIKAMETLCLLEDCSHIFIYPSFFTLTQQKAVDLLIERGAHYLDREQACTQMEFYHAVNMRQEIEGIAQQIIERKADSEDISICVLDPFYEQLCEQIFNRYNIPYTILCDDWRYFCLENAPQFLDGYPNDGSCIVDPETLTVIDYNTTDTAVKYFQKLNEEYQKGIVDPESFTQTYDEYIAKLSTGRVLGMIDQWWDFAYTAGDAIKQAGLDEQGCDYIPLPITIDESVENQWHCSGSVLNVSDGLAITTSCEDVEGALQFVDDLLTQDIHNLRFWGVEGVDYNVDENGEFYRTEEQRTRASDTAYKASHTCTYSYFPQYSGTSDDGINANKPDGQANEFFDGLNDDIKEAFSAYGAETYVDMIGTNEAPGAWYPMWSYSNGFTTDTEGGMAWNKIAEIKHEYLPQVVMAQDFDTAWAEYMEAYNSCNPEAFIGELQTELDKRMEEAAKYE